MLSQGTVVNAEEWVLTGVPMGMTLLLAVQKCHQVGVVIILTRIKTNKTVTKTKDKDKVYGDHFVAGSTEVWPGGGNDDCMNDTKT